MVFKKADENNRKFIHIRLFYTYGPIKREIKNIDNLGFSNSDEVDVLFVRE